jgi:hypothetical protein
LDYIPDQSLILRLRRALKLRQEVAIQRWQTRAGRSAEVRPPSGTRAKTISLEPGEKGGIPEA